MVNLLRTDAYKFSMALAGKPGRTETFYYTHRSGGPHFIPLDIPEMVSSLLPSDAPWDEAYLAAQGFPMNDAFRAGIARVDDLQVAAVAPRTWVFDREPFFSLTGPSALVSWLEPILLRLNYRIQVATEALLRPEALATAVATVSCGEQREIVRATLDAIERRCPPITVAPERYYQAVLEKARELVAAVGDAGRIFEVGMRAATCPEQHRIALRAAKDAGINATSNVELAQELGMKPVGTMGHEHVQRYGSDRAAFAAMRSALPGPVSYLLDTFSTMRSGIPSAFRLLAETGRPDTVRFDSGDKAAQYAFAVREAKRYGIRPRFILEDGFTLGMTRQFEALRETAGVAPEDQFYGFGGYLVNAPWDVLTRDRVSAVWKLTQSGGQATMKFGDAANAGKQSLPGKPMLVEIYEETGSRRVIAQEGEDLGWANTTRLTGALAPAAWLVRPQRRAVAEYSPQTQALVDELAADRAAHITDLQQRAA